MSAIFKFTFSAENKSDENWEKIVRLGCSFHVEFSSQVITMYKESHRIQEEIANFVVNYLINLIIYFYIFSTLVRF